MIESERKEGHERLIKTLKFSLPLNLGSNENRCPFQRKALVRP